MCIKTPKPQPMATPTPAPEPARFNDEAMTAARDDSVRRARASSGTASTIKTTETGLSALYGAPKQLLGQ